MTTQTSLNAEKPVRLMLRALAGEATAETPFWLMRQAGRYLPEYRALRAEAGSFLNLCYHPQWATEVTLQPIRRFDMDAAIVFSDILVVPQALGQPLRFAEGEGPRLEPVRDDAALAKLDRAIDDTLSPVYETLSRVRAELDPDKTLIGFAGAPWTIACYMTEGRGGDFATARGLAAKQPEFFQRLIEKITTDTADYLSRQIEAGADCVQIFDSWAGLCPAADFDRWVIAPTQKIVAAVRTRHPQVPIIGFPRGAADNYGRYAKETGVQALGVDQGATMAGVLQQTGGAVALQGNLSPETLLAGGAQMRDEATAILDAMRGHPFVFNLGHGIIKETPPQHVADLAQLIRSHR